ncbi:MAG TPA: allantoinase AllB [Gemmatimonadaceae bacterium]|nr:allantoinase AllB [Gemmatimonadaceae bacterium]
MPRAIRSQRVLTPDGLRPAIVLIEQGRVTDVAEYQAGNALGDVADAGELVVMPGLVDTHVHVNEPGRTDWEGFETATRAAAAGGVTTLLDMPLNSIPATTSVGALAAKAAAARGKTWVDVGFIGGVVPGNTRALGDLARAGVRAFKCFMVPSGVPEFEHVTDADLRDAMPVLAELGLPLMVHAELPAPIEAATLEAAARDPTLYATYLASRPPAAEHEAIATVIRHAQASGARVHIVHVSSAASATIIAHARAVGVRISAETCPHYLYFDASMVPSGATEYKCAPPIRDAGNRDALWDALERDELEMIVSDHSPCPPILKRRDVGDFFVAWGGIASLQLGASIVWTSMRSRGLGLERLAQWMSDAPARLAGLDGRKGRIAAGYDADLVLFDPDASLTVTADMLLHRHPVTPYLGATLRGRVEATYVRGTLAYDRARGCSSTPAGELLLPSHLRDS